MNEKEKLSFLEEVMDIEDVELTKDMILENIEEWDSLSILTLIAEMKQRFDINFTTKMVKEFKTIGDICDAIPTE